MEKIFQKVRSLLVGVTCFCVMIYQMNACVRDASDGEENLFVGKSDSAKLNSEQSRLSRLIPEDHLIDDAIRQIDVKSLRNIPKHIC